MNTETVASICCNRYRFTLEAVVGAHGFPCATAGTKKEARRRAAVLALNQLALQGRVVLYGHAQQQTNTAQVWNMHEYNVDTTPTCAITNE